MKVVFTSQAQDQIQATYAFISGQNARAADDWLDRITRRADQLSAFPRSGRQVPEVKNESILEVFERDWRIIYYVDEASSVVSVLAIVWGRVPLEPESLGE